MPESTFTGTVLMFSDRPGFESKTVDLAFPATFLPGRRWEVTPRQFGKVEIPDIEVEAFAARLKLVVSLWKTARGTFDLEPGALLVDGSFKFFVALLPSTLDIRLDGGSYTLPGVPGAAVSGAAITAGSGALRLAGAGTFVDPHLHGTKCLVQLEGVFDPVPWGGASPGGPG